MERIPISDTVIYALARVVDDAQSERRDPTHSDIEFQTGKAGLSEGDPNKEGMPVGKAKRVRSVLSWGIEHNPQGAELLAAGLISAIRACGGFREASPNFVGRDAIQDLAGALRDEGVVLGSDGTLTLVALDNLNGRELTKALRVYVNRAKKGIEDAALVIGTSKDLMEAVAAHVLQELTGSYPTTANFPTLLGQAFVALDMATPQHPGDPGEHPRRKVERSMYEMACSINTLRNKQGSGHGRPWVPDLSESEARAGVEFIGVIAEALLTNFEKKRA